MESLRIQSGESERLIVTALDEDNAFLSGLTDVLIDIARVSDGVLVVTQQVMAALPNNSGSYYYDFTPDPDTNYYVRVASATADNSPWEGEIKVGGFIDNLDVSVSSLALQSTLINFIYDMAGGRRKIAVNQELFFKADNVTEIARFDLFDKDGNPTENNVYERWRV